MQTVWVSVVKPGELLITQRTRLILLLFLQDTGRWWTASAMTPCLGFNGDNIRLVHKRLVDAHWAVRVVEDERASMVRHWVQLTAAGVDRARVVLRDGLTPADTVLAAALSLSTAVLNVPAGARPATAPGNGRARAR